MTFLLLIQAGGESKRMGRDKGLVPFLGVPLVQRVLERLRGEADAVLVITNRPGDYAFLGVPLAADLLPGRGALGGLYTALSAARELGAEAAGVIACDLPFASPALLAAAHRLLLSSGAGAVVPRTPGGNEPFHAVYRPAACLPAVLAALSADRWRADAWFTQVQVRFMLPEEWAPYDPQGLAFRNVNTPEELREAEVLARGLQASGAASNS
jgi:molybdopterin-guanine dinucleotide biosynthesis protein A